MVGCIVVVRLIDVDFNFFILVIECGSNNDLFIIVYLLFFM